VSQVPSYNDSFTLGVFGDGGHVKGLASVVLDSGEEEERSRVGVLVDYGEDLVGSERGGWGYRVNEDKGR